jgi:hypothetical protein
VANASEVKTVKDGMPAMEMEKQAPHAAQLCLMFSELPWSASVLSAAISWQGISIMVCVDASSAALTCICVLIAQAELAEIGSHSTKNRQMSLFMT